MYCNNPKYWERQALANGDDPGQKAQNAASDQDLHCLPYLSNTLDTTTGIRMDYFKF